MLHQTLPTIAPHPLDDRARWLLPALGGAALLSLGLIWLQFGIVPTLVLAGLAGGGAFATMTALGMRSSVGISKVTGDQGSDFGLVGAALALCEEPAAITSTDGTLLAANKDGTPINSQADADVAWTQVAKKIGELHAAGRSFGP